MIRSLECFLIDDDVDDQKIFLIITEEIDKSIKCSFANNGVEALKKLTDTPRLPDLIFLDINMPKMDGVECLRRIKKNSALKSIPVYMYSTTADPDTVELTKKLGAVDFIIKPNSINDLEAILTGIYNKYQVEDGSVNRG